jgi:hypothetical protein
MITDSRILPLFPIPFIQYLKTGRIADKGRGRNQYFLRNVDWVGNSVYRKEDLERVFNVEKGTVYNQSLINDRLNGSPVHRMP